ncbi:MAG: XRE family transcriptional regulator [Sphingobacteriales bacterium]|nr:MAG: XRE family transcriptional regulator [Sphingobacteriales bacterium]
MSNFEQRYQKEITSFGERLKLLRISKGLTQLDIDVATGINRTEISKIENGLKNIEFLTLVRLAVALDVELSELFQARPAGAV